MRLPGREFMGIIDDSALWVRDNYGIHHVIAMWMHWSQNILEPTLGPMIEKDGFRGMADFWGPSLEAEKAGARVYYDREQFVLEVSDCPHMRFARENDRPIPGDFDHCLKCFMLYYPIMRKYGYNMESTVHGQSGYCVLRVTRQKRSAIPAVDKKLTG